MRFYPKIDAELWDLLVSDYLRPERPSWAACVRRIRLVAEARGLPLPSASTLYRKLTRDMEPSLTNSRRLGGFRRLVWPR